MLRSIRDGRGEAWRVWAVLPMWLEHHRLLDPTTGKERMPLPPELSGGWLAFESARGERRRIGPLPDGWEDLDEAALVHVLERAAVVASKPAAVRHPAARPESPPPSAAPTP